MTEKRALEDALIDAAALVMREGAPPQEWHTRDGIYRRKGDGSVTFEPYWPDDDT